VRADCAARFEGANSQDDVIENVRLDADERLGRGRVEKKVAATL
jgi:hypothetical protein